MRLIGLAVMLAFAPDAAKTQPTALPPVSLVLTLEVLDPNA